AVFVDQLAQQRPVELLRVHIGDALGAAPLPMLDLVGKELATAADAAFEETKAQLGEAPRDAAEEQPLGHGVAGRREMADMVEGEVARIVAQAKAAPAGMEGRRNAELQALPPVRVVIVIAVQAELVVEHRMARE